MCCELESIEPNDATAEINLTRTGSGAESLGEVIEPAPLDQDARFQEDLQVLGRRITTPADAAGEVDDHPSLA